MQRLCKEEQKDLRFVLGSFCHQFEVMAAIPNRYQKVEGVTETSLAAIEYISFIAYPEVGKQRKRENFCDSLLQAVLRAQNSVRELNKHFESPKEWPRIDTCLNKGKKRHYKACVLWQAYTHYCRYINQAESDGETINRGWYDFLIKYYAFYQNYDDGFAFGKYQSDFQELYNNRLDFQNIKNHGEKDELRPVIKDWSVFKNSLNLVYGLITAFEKQGVKSLPSLNVLISEPFWVYEATKNSQYKLAKYLRDVKEKQPQVKTSIDPIKMPFLDLSFDPIFIRKDSIF
ncbi:hypothetical protein [Pseudoalteromonas tetraodonis]|uniref:hypothetical protein n=1 Tax=Pseudoalteromonas tetraodonis TaxID=43659 RepID=UPI000849864C|nr:hypothetical protein [Pseudoalteromonas tetraodonis]ODS13950.1 hypothetical protein BCD66_08365 [Pseudoalteromonas tetraodonis]